MGKNIRVLKMISGEEIICEVVAESELHMIVNKPFMFQVIEAHQGQLALAMTPYVLCDPNIENLPLKHLAIAFDIPAPTQPEKEYLSQTSSIELLS